MVLDTIVFACANTLKEYPRSRLQVSGSEVAYARYPLKVAGKWVTPMEYYTREKARGIIENAKFVVEGIKAYLKRTTTQET